MQDLHMQFGAPIPLDSDYKKELDAAGEPHPPPTTVIGPGGEPITLANLPKPDTKRWVTNKKLAIIAAVRGGLLTLEQVGERYGIDPDEYNEWISLVKANGREGLKVTQPGNLLRALSNDTDDVTEHPRRVDLPMTTFRVGDVLVNLRTGEISNGVGISTYLQTGQERRVCSLFFRKPGKVITKPAFFADIYAGETDLPEVKIIDVFVCKLRSKVAAFADAFRFETVWGRGYVLRCTGEVQQVS